MNETRKLKGREKREMLGKVLAPLGEEHERDYLSKAICCKQTLGGGEITNNGNRDSRVFKNDNEA